MELDAEGPGHRIIQHIADSQTPPKHGQIFKIISESVTDTALHQFNPAVRIFTDLVVSGCDDVDIVPCASDQSINAVSTIQHIFAGPRDQYIVAIATEELIIPTTRLKNIVTDSTVQAIVPNPTIQMIVPMFSVQHIGPVPAYQFIIARSAIEPIIPHAPFNPVALVRSHQPQERQIPPQE